MVKPTVRLELPVVSSAHAKTPLPLVLSTCPFVPSVLGIVNAPTVIVPDIKRFASLSKSINVVPVVFIFPIPFAL